MVGILLCRFFRRVSVVLVLSAVFIAGAEAVQFNQPNNQFNMVVGTESWIYWSYAVGVVTLTLGGASPNNTNFNMTIGKQHHLEVEDLSIPYRRWKAADVAECVCPRMDEW